MNSDPSPPRGNPMDATSGNPRRPLRLWMIAVAVVVLSLAFTLLLPLSSRSDRKSPPGPRETAGMRDPSATGQPAGKLVVAFDSSAALPRGDALGTMDRVVAFLKDNPSARVSLKGFPDSLGDPEANRRLTEERVENVRKSLAAAGISDGRITTVSAAEPAARSGADSPSREAGPRVEIEMVK